MFGWELEFRPIVWARTFVPSYPLFSFQGKELTTSLMYTLLISDLRILTNVLKFGPWVIITNVHLNNLLCVIYGNIGLIVRFAEEPALTVDMSFSCHHQSVSMCSLATGTTVLTTACMAATAKGQSSKGCLFCTGTEVSTMMISSRLSKPSMKPYET